VKVAYLLQDTRFLYGAERATVDLARGLQAHCDTRAWLIEETRLGPSSSALREAFRTSGVATRSFAVARRFSLRLARHLARAANEEGIDIVHCAGYKADVHALLSRSLGGKAKLVSTVHGWLNRPDLKERFYGALNLWALRRFDRVVALSSYYEEWLRARGLTDVRRIPAGLQDAGSLQCPPPESKELRIGILGRLSWEKNLRMALEAAHLLMRRGVEIRLLIAGEGPERASLERLIADSGLGTFVSLAGFMDRKQFLSRIQVLVCCSHIENLPYTLMESMACARPIVATRVGGIPDLVEDGVTGYLVEDGDAGSLAEHLERLAADADLRARMGEAGRRKLEREFSPDRCRERMRDLYLELSNRT